MSNTTEIVGRIVNSLNELPKKSTIDTPTNNIDELVTESEHGLMSKDDKKKLDKIDENANYYELPEASTDELGGVKIGTSAITDPDDSSITLTPVPILEGIPYYKDYILPKASETVLGGVKVSTGLNIDGNGNLSVGTITSSNFTGKLPISKGGTGANTSSTARKNLNVMPFVNVGNITSSDVTNDGYFKAFSIASSANTSYIIRLMITPINISVFPFYPVDLYLYLQSNTSTKSNPIVYSDFPNGYVDILDKLYIISNNSVPTGNYEIWYKNTQANSAIRITITDCICSLDSDNDSLDRIIINSSSTVSNNTLSEGIPNIYKLSQILLTRISSYEETGFKSDGFMTKDDKKKLDGIEENANHYELPKASNSEFGGVKTESTVTSTSGLTPVPIINGIPYYVDSSFSKLGISATVNEINQLSGVTSNIQTQINDTNNSINDILDQINTCLININNSLSVTE